MGKLFLMMAALMGGVAVHAVDFNDSAVWDNIKGCCVRGVPEAATVKAASEYLDSVDENTVKADWQKRAMIRARVIVFSRTAGVDASFAGLKAYVDNLIAGMEFEKPLSVPGYFQFFNCWWRDKDLQYAKDFYAYMKATPGSEKFPDLGLWAAALGKYEEAYDVYFANKARFTIIRMVRIALDHLDDPGKAFAAAKLMVSGQSCTAQQVKEVMNLVAQRLIGNDAIPEAEMKGFLKNVNRKYTAYLPGDPQTWEPIISQVRNLLDAY